MGFDSDGFAEAAADDSGQLDKYADLEAYLEYKNAR